ncbi:MAG: Aminotransferase class V, partial [Parcubacteria group bacterium GW2011_GWF2_44_8]
MFNLFGKKRRIYLDTAAATPVRKEVRAAMLPYLENEFGNPSAIHAEGIAARSAVESSRQKVATTLGIRPEGVLFTSGGTESNNLAILGRLKYLARKEGIAYSDMEVVTTRIEHPSILSLIPVIEATGVTVRFVEVDEEGKITVAALEKVLSPKTVLVTFAYANSEVGVVQSVSRLVRTVRQFEKTHTHGRRIVVHIDAAQAPLWLPCSLTSLGVDMMSLDVGKCNGPKGVGMLVVRGNVPLLPILYGGGQEQGLRPGTENVANIVGGATALALAQADYKERAASVSKLRDSFIDLLTEALPEMLLNGPRGEDRLANNINLSLPKFDTEYAVVYLDAQGIAASTKSACAGAGGGESVVVSTMTGNS